MDVLCSLCTQPEPTLHYTPPSDTDYTCSSCVQLLLDTPQDELKADHALALDKGYTAKADSIAAFIIPPEVRAAGFKTKLKTKKRRTQSWQKRRLIR